MLLFNTPEQIAPLREGSKVAAAWGTVIDTARVSGVGGRYREILKSARELFHCDQDANGETSPIRRRCSTCRFGARTEVLDPDADPQMTASPDDAAFEKPKRGRPALHRDSTSSETSTSV